MNNFSITKCTAVLATFLTIGGVALTSAPASAATIQATSSAAAEAAPTEALPAPFVRSLFFDPRKTNSYFSGTANPNARVLIHLGTRLITASADEHGAFLLSNVTGLTGESVSGTVTQQIGGDESPATSFTLKARLDDPIEPAVITTKTYSTDSQVNTVSGTSYPGALVGITVDGKRYATNASTNGTWSIADVPSLGSTSEVITVVQYIDDRVSQGASYTLHAESPSPKTLVPVAFTNPANPADGYTANASFIFRGTAAPGATITLQNDKGTVIARNLTTAADGTWSWTRADMATSIWKITAIADAGTASEQSTTLGNFAPRP